MRPQSLDPIVLGLSSKHLETGPDPTLSNPSYLHSSTVLLTAKSNHVTPPSSHLLKTSIGCPFVLRIWCLLISLAFAFLTLFFKLFTLWKMPHFLSPLGLHTYLESSVWNIPPYPMPFIMPPSVISCLLFIFQV